MVQQTFLQRYPRWVWFVVVGALLASDRLSKAYFAALIPLGGVIEMTPWFNLVHVLNTGAAFSFLADAGGWQRWFFVIFGLLVLAPVTVMCLMQRMEPGERWTGALMVAGGSGNLWDRIQTGAVVDFLDLHLSGWHWPAFNLADVYIVAAVAVWVGLSFIARAPTNQEQP